MRQRFMPRPTTREWWDDRRDRTWLHAHMEDLLVSIAIAMLFGGGMVFGHFVW